MLHMKECWIIGSRFLASDLEEMYSARPEFTTLRHSTLIHPTGFVAKQTLSEFKADERRSFFKNSTLVTATCEVKQRAGDSRTLSLLFAMSLLGTPPILAVVQDN